LILVVLNLPLIGIWVKMLTIPYNVLFPAIMAFSIIGAFTVSGSGVDLYTVALFGVLGYILVRLQCEPAPLLLGFVLGPMLEEHLRRSMILSRGSPSIFIDRPVSAVLLVLALIMLVLAVLPAIAKKREVVFVED